MTINNGTAGAITLNTTNTALSGTAANLAAAFAGTVTEHTGTVTITDAPSVTELKTINAGSTGAITLNVTNGALSGSSSDLAAAFAGTVTEHTGTVTITNADYTVAELKTINAATTGAITLNTTDTALSGDAADLVLAFAGTVTEHTGTVTITDAPNVTQLKTINAATTGAITLDVTNGALSGSSSDLALAFAGTVTEHTGTVGITNADYTVAELKTINAASTGAITFTTATTALSDTSSNLAVALNGTTNHNAAVTVTNADYTAAELATINNGTSGAITLNTTDTALSGTSSSLAAAFAGTVTEHTGTIGITNADYTVAELKTINAASTGAITFTTATTALSDTSANMAVALNGTTNHNAAVTVTNADYTAAELATINNGTAGAITLNTTDTALSGTAANLAAAFAGTVTEHTGTVTITRDMHLALRN